MKRRVKRTVIVVLVLFAAMQFYQPAQNKNGEPDAGKLIAAAPEVRQIIQVSCYDCHSNNTRYMWYDYIQPARWFVERHIQHAKTELNFDEWQTYSGRKQTRLLKSIKSQVEARKMPLPSYTWSHPDAKLDNEKIQVLIQWLNRQQDIVNENSGKGYHSNKE